MKVVGGGCDVAERNRDVRHAPEDPVVTNQSVVQNTAGPRAGSPVGTMASPLVSPTFLERDRECSLSQLDAKQLAGGQGSPTLVDACEEGVAYAVERLGCDQSLDHKAGVERDWIW
jgi:hypothetical protein